MSLFRSTEGSKVAQSGVCVSYIMQVQYTSAWQVLTCLLQSVDFELPTVKFEFNKRNFIVRSLFQYV